LRAFLVVSALLALATAVAWPGPRASASAGSCGSGEHGPRGYAYAGHQAVAVAHGIRATIAMLRTPRVREGHVAGWIGVGGPGAGARGRDQWLQAGVAALPGEAPLLYVEIMRAGGGPVFRPVQFDLRPGEHHQVAVTELAGRPSWWRVWVDGKPVTEPISLPGSSNRWKPIATAEAWNGGKAVCNAFAFRFEQVGVAQRLGGAWAQFVPGYRFLDRGLSLRQLRPTANGARVLAAGAIPPFAFEATTPA
jgi:hypothetical protein